MRAEAIAQMLPEVFQAELGRDAQRAHTPLAALLAVMETLHEPVENVLASVDAPFAAYRAPDPFVVYLSMWVDLAWLVLSTPGGARVLLPGGVGRLRDVIASASDLSARRGTAGGLARFLEVATASRPVVVDTDRDRPFSARVMMPAEARAFEVLIRTIVEAEKPAHVTYELTFAEPG